MSRVERTEEPSERRAERRCGETPRADPNRREMPSKAEGEESDVEQALRNSERVSISPKSRH